MTPSAPVVICPIRYDGGVRGEDHKLWIELRKVFAESSTQLLGFVSVSRQTYWIDEFNPLPAATSSTSRSCCPGHSV
jgi:hypothetical protein